MSSVEEVSHPPSNEECGMEEEALVLSEKRPRCDLSDANLDVLDENTSGKRHRTDISEQQSCEDSLQIPTAVYTEAPASSPNGGVDLVVNEMEVANLENGIDTEAPASSPNVKLDLVVNEIGVANQESGIDTEAPARSPSDDKLDLLVNETDVADPGNGINDALAIEEHKKLKCEMCNIDCNSKKDLKLHLEGKKHRKLQQSVNRKKTLPVNEKTQVPVNEEHGEPATEALAQKGNHEDSTNGPALSKEETASKALEQLICYPCQVICNSQRDYEQHVSGRKHVARVKRLLVKGANNNEGVFLEKTLQAEHANGVDVSKCELVGNNLEGETSSHVAPVDLELTTEGGFVSKSAIPNSEAGKVVNGEGAMQVDPLSLEASKRIVIQGRSVDKKLGEYLKNLPTNNEATCFVSALDSMGMLLCPAMQNPKGGSFSQVNPGFSIGTDQSRNEVFYDLCGLDCGKSHEDYAYVLMHAGCFLKLLKSAYSSAGDKSSLHNGVPEEMDCKMCRVEFGSKVDLESHMNGKKHAAQVKKLQLRCEICNVNCSSPKALEAHLAGKAHASKLRLSQKRTIVLD